MHGRARRHTLLRLAAVAMAATTFLAAGCGGDNDDEPSPTAGAPTSAAAATTAATVTAPTAAATAAATETAGGTTVMVAEGAAAAGGALLTDGDGRTLYTFNNDTAGSGTSACSPGCFKAWPPLLAGTSALTAGPGLTGTLGTIPAGGGEGQVTYNGLPLYYFTSDAAPGDTNGKAIPNWTLAAP